MIFKRGRKRGSESAVDESSEDVGVDELDETAEPLIRSRSQTTLQTRISRPSMSWTGEAQDHTTSAKSRASKARRKARRSISAA